MQFDPRNPRRALSPPFKVYYIIAFFEALIEVIKLRYNSYHYK